MVVPPDRHGREQQYLGLPLATIISEYHCWVSYDPPLFMVVASVSIFVAPSARPVLIHRIVVDRKSLTSSLP